MFNIHRARRIIQTLAIASAVIAAPLLIIASNPTAARATSVGVPPCQGSNLAGAFVANQVGTGHVVTTIAITNVGRQVCTLGGYPTLIVFEVQRNTNCESRATAPTGAIFTHEALPTNERGVDSQYR